VLNRAATVDRDVTIVPEWVHAVLYARRREERERRGAAERTRDGL
jgi:hypothetical protein